MLWALCVVVSALSFLKLGTGKMCTNTGVSHTLRSQYLDSGTTNAAFDAYFERAAENYTYLLDNLHGPSRLRRSMLQQSILQGASLDKVKLAANSRYGTAQQTNLNYLLMLDVDNLVYSFRINAGLNASGSAYGGWESVDSELRGHFVGHYLSATALMWASTQNENISEKMKKLVEALKECQDKVGSGYLSAFPTSLFDRFEALQPVWAPYYTIHKIMAGLLDQYTFAGSKAALDMVVKMADYFVKRVDAVIESFTIERHWQSLNEETGGMNDVMYRLYSVTANKDHLRLAHLFDKPCFLGLLAVKADSVSGFHANTHIPVVVGAQMRYEVTGDTLFKAITQYFMSVINSSHAYATGGTSVGEFWSDPYRLGSTLETENEESCTTYNMLKVARNLFRWSKDITYADYYERALLNGVISIQRGQEPGVMIYMLPLGAGSSKAKSYHGWGTPYSSFWCCYGTATESFSKLGDSIYFTDSGSIPILYVTQFVSSTFAWDESGVMLEQNVDEPKSISPALRVLFTMKQGSKTAVTEATLKVRIPKWVASSGYEALLNGVQYGSLTPGTFLSITRLWKAEDSLSLSLPMKITLEHIQDDRANYSSLHAIYYGPYLLAGMSDGDYAMGPVDVNSPTDWITPINDTSENAKLFTLEHWSLNSNSLQVVALGNDGYMTLIDRPSHGSKEAPKATFRVSSSHSDFEFHGDRDLLLYREVSLEVMEQSGYYIAHDGVDRRITFLQHNSIPQDSYRAVFRVLPGLSGEEKSVSFESKDGCFLVVVTQNVELKCRQHNQSDVSFDNAAASFTVAKATAAYHRLSFIAKGSSRSYTLFPLNDYSDESYTVYFDIK